MEFSVDECLFCTAQSGDARRERGHSGRRWVIRVFWGGEGESTTRVVVQSGSLNPVLGETTADWHWSSPGGREGERSVLVWACGPPHWPATLVPPGRREISFVKGNGRTSLTDLLADITSNGNAVQSEEARALAAEATLAGRVDATLREVEANSAETEAVDAKLEVEIARAKGAEATLQAELDDLLGKHLNLSQAHANLSVEFAQMLETEITGLRQGQQTLSNELDAKIQEVTTGIATSAANTLREAKAYTDSKVSGNAAAKDMERL